MEIALGIDPDLHHCAYAFATASKVLAVGVVKVSDKITGDKAAPEMNRRLVSAFECFRRHYEPALAVVEGQQIYLGGNTQANPDSILRLGQVAGGAMALAYAAWPGLLVIAPRPQRWKGNVPKKIHHGRILNRYGVRTSEGGEFTPGSLKADGEDHIEASHWIHVLDAIGLAHWGLTRGRAPSARSSAARREAAG